MVLYVSNVIASEFGKECPKKIKIGKKVQENETLVGSKLLNIFLPFMVE